MPSKYNVYQFKEYLKDKSRLIIFDKISNLKYKIENCHFWVKGFYIITVGLNKAIEKLKLCNKEGFEFQFKNLDL